MKTQWAMAGLIIALAGYAVGASAVEPSAVLQQPQGRVFVGQATVMTPAQHGMPLYAGNRVMVTASGGATVVYADGCSVALAENSLLAISGPDQCKTGQAVAHTTGGFQNTPIGQAGPTRSRSAVATVRQVQGTGLVNRSRARQGMSLFRNYRVKAGPNSQVVVKFSNGCEAVVEAGKTLLIDRAPECQVEKMGEEATAATGAEATTGAGAAGAAGAGAGAAGAAGAVGAGIGTGALVVGGALGVSLIAAIANDDESASESQ
jgi:hypothetical protein